MSFARRRLIAVPFRFEGPPQLLKDGVVDPAGGRGAPPAVCRGDAPMPDRPHRGCPRPRVAVGARCLEGEGGGPPREPSAPSTGATTSA